MPPPNPNLPYVPTRRVSRARAFDVWRCLPALRVRYRRSLFFSLTHTYTYNTRSSSVSLPPPPEPARRRITATSIIIVTRLLPEFLGAVRRARKSRSLDNHQEVGLVSQSATSRRNGRRRGGHSAGVRPFRVLGIARAHFAVVLCSCSFSCVQTLLYDIQ